MYRSSTKEVLPEDDEEDFYYNDDRSDNEDEDEENAGYEDEEPIEDQFEAALANRGGSHVWAEGGVRKDIAIRVLVQCFSSMVESFPNENAVMDHKGRFRDEDMKYTKLLDASKHVVRAKEILLKNENFDTREFTIFIAQKLWVKNILRPLLELCAKEDSVLAMNCCSLALVLVKKISDKTMKMTQKKPKRASRKDAKSSEKGAEEIQDSHSEDENDIVSAIKSAKSQLSALLTIKEGLCSAKCNEAITNSFKEFWNRESVATTEQGKLGIAICLSYFRRLLAICPHPDWSSPSEMAEQRKVQNKFICQLRLLFSLLPGIISDIGRSYHDDWLGDILIILNYVCEGFSSNDLFLVWKSKALIDDLSGSLPAEEIVASKLSSQVINVPDAINRHFVQKAVGEKSLSEKLKGNRLTSAGATAAPRFSRHGSTYRLPVRSVATSEPIATNAVLKDILGDANDPSDDAVETARVVPSTAIIMKNPFACASRSLPEAKQKRNKRNLTFKQENPYLEMMTVQAKADSDGLRACVVVASLMELITIDACFKSFVRRINEDLRRDEMRISPEMELQYFAVITKMLGYNRLKLEDEYRLHKSASGPTEGAIAIGAARWEPNLLNVIDTLDKMSFTRVVFSIDRLSKNKDRLSDIIYPLALYTEMVCYLRILLESSVEGHHEIAIGALYRLFYSTSERLDPLPKLLSEWKPGFFTRRYLTALVELFHQTMKTLEAAKSLFASQGIASEEALKKTRRDMRSKKEMDMEQYLLACWRFSPDDYFKRLVNQKNVKLYVRLLAHIEDNDPVVNHRVHVFLQRLCSFKLDSDMHSPNSVANVDFAANAVGAGSGMVNLGYMLFNLHSLVTIHSVLENESVTRNSRYEPMVRLLRSIVRSFGELAAKNHLLFVEALFPATSRPHEHCMLLDSVYDAGLYSRSASMPESVGMKAMDLNKALDFASERHSDSGGSGSSSDSSSDDVADEFDENDLIQALKPADASAAGRGSSSKKKALGDKVSKKKLASKSKNRRRARDRSIDSSDADSDGESSARQGQEPVRRPVRASRMAWTADEDKVLTELYRLYAGSHSVFTSIAASSELRAFGNKRSEVQISNRVRQLELHLAVSKSDQESASEADSDGGYDESRIVRESRPSSPENVPIDSAPAAWDVEDNTDVIEQRMRALERLGDEIFGNSPSPVAPKSKGQGKGKGKGKGKGLKKRKRSSAEESDDDSDINLQPSQQPRKEGEEEDEDETQPQFSETPIAISNGNKKSLRALLDSDDEEV